MQKLTHRIYSFDEFSLDVTRESLVRGSNEIKLRPKSFGVLKYLVENGGRLVTKEELFDAIWADSSVTDDSLVKCIKDVRDALGDEAQRLIKTVPRRGYVFDPEVNENGSNGQIYSEETTGVHLVIEETETEAAPHGPPKISGMFAALKRRKLATAIAIATIVLVGGGIAFGIYLYYLRPPKSPFKSVSIIKNLTTDGNAGYVAVSPDGKYFAYTIFEGGQDSLWVRQVAVLKGVQIVKPSADAFAGVTFSPDGNYVYYVQNRVLYQTGTFGGATRKLWEEVDTNVTFSPDGKRLAFVRRGTGDGLGSRLVLASADGSGEPQILANRKPPESFTIGGCDWSPDGAIIVCSGGDNGLFGKQLPIAVRVSNGRQTPITVRTWDKVRSLDWMPDGTGFIMCANGQIWHVTYPDGAPTKIYNDLNFYRAVSLTTDSDTLVAVQEHPQINFHVLDLSKEPREDRQLTFDSIGGNISLTAAPDGKIVYSSDAGGAPDLWIMDPDGSNKKQVTNDGSDELNPMVSPDGRSVAFGVPSEGIWKVDLDGGKRRQLTAYGMFPCYSGDGNWVFYTLPRDKWSLWKVASQGGEPVRITDYPAVQPAVSPDGKLIAYMNLITPGAPKLYIVP
ncbi:MAG: winged helix-turn-helix domain-containing protein, partial [Pyrinomonadaceae bacterium]